MEPGTRLEQYEIGDKLGEGGMGAVYQAVDTRLKRPVAIKVLPPRLSADRERLARLEREAHLLASLNHPNVATVHGFAETDVEDEEGSRRVAFLVMELVEGESLHDRLATGPPPWREAVEIAEGIAAGLEAAHERGIVHRDLKPANVQLATDGTVKVLDFGLAKAFEADIAGDSPELSASPTLAPTRSGLILGTAAYMSPEQARGKTVDRRTDIWALGVVLYEMLTGRKAFDGETVSDVLAAILKESLDFEALPPLPERLSILLERMLQKDPGLRLRDVGDARLELEAARTERPRPRVPETSESSRGAQIGLSALLLLAGLGIGWLLRGAPEPPPERHVMLAPDSIADGLDSLALSPDGTLLAELAVDQQIRLRSVDDPSWRELAGTEAGLALSFDADGDRIYFSQDHEVLSVDVNGGSPIVEGVLPEETAIYALFRGLDGAIHASTWREGRTELFRIPSGGGAESLWSGSVTTEDNFRTIVTTQLAAGRWMGWAATVDASRGLGIIEAGEAEPSVLLPGYRSPLHLGDGEVLTVDDRGRLSAMRVAPATGEPRARPVVRVEGLALIGNNFPAFEATAEGTLAYVSGTVGEGGEILAWLGRDGGQTEATARTGTSHLIDSRLSPDGRFLALEVPGEDDSPVSVWIHDLERDVRTALTPGVRATFPVWSPDGREIALRLGEGADPKGIYVVPADRSAPPRLLLPENGDETFLLPMGWSPDGSELLYVQSASRVGDPGAASSLWTMPPNGGEPEVFLDTPANENSGRYSPDGRWIAYSSDQSGQREIYLRPAEGGGEIRISAEGGTDPEWNPAGDELFFLRGRQLFAVTVTGDRPSVSAERRLVQLPTMARNRFAIPGPAGERFIISIAAGGQDATAVHGIFNWRRGVAR